MTARSTRSLNPHSQALDMMIRQGPIESSEINGEERIARFTEGSWRDTHGATSVYMRYYLLPFEPKDGFSIPGFNGDVVCFGHTPFKVAVAHIAEKKYSTRVPWVVDQTAQEQTVAIENLNRLMPTAVYVVITTPLRGDIERADGHLAASSSVDQLIGLMRSFSGNNLFRQRAYDCIVELDGEYKETTSTSVVPLIHSFEGPYTSAEVWLAFDEITSALLTCDVHLRNRLMRVAQLIEHGASAPLGLKYFSYWIALEVAADTHSFGKIVTLLRDAYSVKDNASVQNVLGLTALKDMRTAVFHHGAPYDMNPAVERYFQQLLLDVIRAKLGLSCNRYMQQAIDEGFDLSFLCIEAGVILNVDFPDESVHE
jgi:hypothetical protein